MACQPLTRIDNFSKRERETRRSVHTATRYITHIEQAKTLVCGVIADDPKTKLRKHLEEVIPIIDANLQALAAGVLDGATDDQLRQQAEFLQIIDNKLSLIINGSIRIGLEAVEPFPRLLSELRMRQHRLQSQHEGILLSLNDSFQEAIADSAREITALG
jgi:hypothetical protein